MQAVSHSQAQDRAAVTAPLRAVLISTYELGHQPFGLASPAAWLRRAGIQVDTVDLSRGPLDAVAVRAADLIALYVPMHTATRLAVEVLDQVRHLNSTGHICFFGLYAPANADYLRRLGAQTVLGGEFESDLVALARRLASHRPADKASTDPSPRAVVSTARQEFIVPDRSGLPPLTEYAMVVDGTDHRIAGYTEASRGCRHRCRHCPVVPVYDGRFRIVPPDVVLADIDQQVGAGAQHITFGDPDFFNGPAHAMRIVDAMHTTYPDLTYDVTVKVEHLIRRPDLIARLQQTGCLFVTSAIESIDDKVLDRLDKGHSRADFLQIVHQFRAIGLTLNPTFVTFHPWLSLGDYRELLSVLDELDLVEAVASVQLAIRLLIPAGSKLLELEEIQKLVDEFDEAKLSHIWRHPDPRVDRLFADVLAAVEAGVSETASRRDIFERVWAIANAADPSINRSAVGRPPRPDRQAPPHLTEPWFCCSEPLGSTPPVPADHHVNELVVLQTRRKQ